MIQEINADNALALLQAEVEAEGLDYVYTQPESPAGNPMCVYVYDGKPSCLVGRALAKAGVPLKVLVEMDLTGPIEDPDVLEILEKAGFELDQRAVEALSTAQFRQDAKHPWGRALEGAREVVVAPLG